MKINSRGLKNQRISLDEKIGIASQYASLVKPRGGWLRAIRTSLGMTSTQLAKRLGIAQPNVLALETRETKGKITLEMLERAAQAMGCELRYVVVPRVRLETMVDEQAEKVARSMLHKTSHMMRLEAQSVEAPEMQAHVDELKAELKNSRISKIWEKS